MKIKPWPEYPLSNEYSGYLSKKEEIMTNSAKLTRSLDELLERDALREKDGFPRKIRIGRLIKPGQDKKKIVVVPTTVEEKLLHDKNFRSRTGEDQSGGSGDGEEGEVIDKESVRKEGSAGSGPGGESGDSHETESNAYDLGKILTEKFHLPNLKDKGKKRSLTRYTYDLTDRHQGSGQVLDKKATLRKIIETNIALNVLSDPSAINPEGLLIAPSDKVYRVLSPEKDFESQAVVFFLRDYSGSMGGKRTEIIVSQHVLIYSWLLYQYAGRVESRFILHDTEAKEVPDFYTYFNLKVAGGTKIASAYRLVNEIVAKESLAVDNNIYVFQGTDGDDWDSNGEESLPEIKKILIFVNRMGITVVKTGTSETRFEGYLKKSGVLDKKSLVRLDTIAENEGDENRLIEGIKRLTSE